MNNNKIQNRIRDINEKLQILEKQATSINYRDIKIDNLRKLTNSMSVLLQETIPQIQNMEENSYEMQQDSLLFLREQNNLSKIISKFMSYLKFLKKIIKNICIRFMKLFAQEPQTTEMATFNTIY